MHLHRKAISHLSNWAESPNRKPLILRGARQVGKSTLIEQFAAHAGYDLHTINLDLTTLNLGTKINLDQLLKEIEALSEKRIGPNSLIFFDEIQKQIELYPYLRYFFEKRPDLKVVAAGSLLEFYLERATGDIPVGRLQYYFLGPLTFFEFLKATKKQLLYEHLTSFIKGTAREIHPTYHEQALEQFSLYLRVGGLPESTREFIKTGSLIETNHIHQAIIQTYEDDFIKYAERSQLAKLDTLFAKLPTRVGEKIKWSEIDSAIKSRDLSRAYDLLCKSRLMLKCVHTNATGLSLAGQSDESVFKSFLLDVGLLLSKLEVAQRPFDLKSDIAEKGKIFEQFVAQMLFYAKGPIYEPKLYYWLRDKKSRNAEVDFVIQTNQEIVPIEVKNQPLTKMRSLQLFCKEQNIKRAVNFYLGTYSREQIADTQILRLPIYLAEMVYRILESHDI
jgi:predicted AAA+ superfamily ATPase